MILHVKENLEELIVRLLAKRPRVSANGIHQEIAGQGKKYSLQAVYKGLKKLQAGGVAVKMKQGYSLRLPWVLDFAALADEMSHAYLDRLTLDSILPSHGKKEIWHFNNLLKMNDFWSHILLTLLQQSRRKVLLGWNPHPWFHLAQTKQEEQYIKALGLAQSRLYLVIGGNTHLDRWAEKFFDKKVVVHAFAKNFIAKDQSVYLNVIDDYIITVKLDAKTTQAIDGLYSQTGSAEALDVARVMAIFNGKVKASVWLEKSPSKAEAIRRKFSRFFGIKLET